LQPLLSQVHAALLMVHALVLAPPLLLPLPELLPPDPLDDELPWPPSLLPLDDDPPELPEPPITAPSPLSFDDPLLELDSTPPSPTVPPDDELELEQAIARSAAGRTTSARVISEGCLRFIGSRNPAPLGSYPVRYDA
jgi:hypothetical protein